MDTVLTSVLPPAPKEEVDREVRKSNDEQLLGSSPSEASDLIAQVRQLPPFAMNYLKVSSF